MAVYAATTTATPTGGRHWHGHHHGFMGLVLHKLDLTDAQKAQVKSIMAGQKSQFQALRTSSQTNRDALASTPPTDTAAYAALVATAQKNAATRVQLESETWSNIYSNVLTQTQRDTIPNIVAAAKAQREQWQAEHAAAGSSGE
jgi:Spy/CpxP family protein refolding chaperone